MIEVEIDIPVPHEKVWACLTQNEHIHHWWSEGVSLDRKNGGKFSEVWTDLQGQKHETSGIVTALENKIRLQMDWKDKNWPKATRVEFLLSPWQGGTKLTLQHSGWGIFDDKTRQKIVDDYRAGWLEIMDKLKDYCIHKK